MKRGFLALLIFASWGGGIYKSLNAIELSEICKPPDKDCEISKEKLKGEADIQNSNSISINKLTISASIDNFINTQSIVLANDNNIEFSNGGKITKVINYGSISGGFNGYNGNTISVIENYGEMRGFASRGISQNLTIKNYGIIKTNNGSYISGNGSAANAAHFVFEASNSAITLQNYKIMILESQSDFNAFTGYSDRTNNKNSHLIFWLNSDKTSTINFDGNSNIMLDISGDFELNKEYKIAKLVTDTNGNPINNLDIKSHLALSDEIKDLYTLTKSGEYFTIKLLNKITETPITAIYKSNIRTMNNFLILSNSMIYPQKYSKSQNLGRKISKNILSLRASISERGNPLIDSALDSANHLKSYESFSYRNESQNRRIKRTNKRNYSRNLKDSSLRASVSERGNPQNQRNSQNLAQNPHDYYFILTPFVNHNLFFESGRYNLSGFDYGFLTAFSARVAESNSLGTHFMMSYGSLNDKHDKDLSITSMNFMLGLNYKLDLIYDMFLKARGDVFYFSNALDSATIKNIKPSNLGFGASVLFGKEWDFKQGGVLGIEAGIDYKALKSNKVSIDSQEYQQALYNLIYADVGVNYAKYFGGFGVNLGGGFKANLAPNLAKVILLANSQNLRFVLDNDKYLGYANMALSYVLNARNFDMEFSLAYYGNFGDRIISNGGGFEWRVGW